jgi:hypothetical protein
MSGDERKSINPAALAPADAALLLKKLGAKVTDEHLQDDLADGAPTNTDGTINLVHYAAWLLKEMGRGSS